jgi:hypothetical protein
MCSEQARCTYDEQLNAVEKGGGTDGTLCDDEEAEENRVGRDVGKREGQFDRNIVSIEINFRRKSTKSVKNNRVKTKLLRISDDLRDTVLRLYLDKCINIINP